MATARLACGRFGEARPRLLLEWESRTCLLMWSSGMRPVPCAGAPRDV